MTKRIFRSITLVAAVVLLASFIVTLGVLSEYFGGVQKELLHDELGLAAAAVETDGTEYLERAKSANYRLTWIDSDGTVIYDSQADAASMQNHLGREEVDSALRTGVGESTRYSSTLLERLHITPSACLTARCCAFRQAAIRRSCSRWACCSRCSLCWPRR